MEKGLTVSACRRTQGSISNRGFGPAGLSFVLSPKHRPSGENGWTGPRSIRCIVCCGNRRPSGDEARDLR